MHKIQVFGMVRGGGGEVKFVTLWTKLWNILGFLKVFLV
jgi:hypothetical protein